MLHTLQLGFWTGEGQEPQPVPMEPNPHAVAPAKRGLSQAARDALARWKDGDISAA